MVDMLPYRNAISNIESGGRYDILGPIANSSGDRAYGRYQVMGANIPSWTEQALGVRMTPQQFLASPEAQDAVFDHIFGGYVERYGPEGAARAWFTGSPTGGGADVLGTTANHYVDMFNGGLGVAPAEAMPSGGQNTPEMAENSAPQVMPNPPETPVQAVVRSLGEQMANRPQPAAEPAGPVQTSPLMAAADMDVSRQKLGQMKGFLLPEPETTATAPAPMSLAREGSDGPLGLLKKPEMGAQNGFSAMFRGAKPAPLGGGIRVRG